MGPIWTESALRGMRVAGRNITGQGLFEMLAAAAAAGRQHLADASVEAFDHPVGLGMSGFEGAMLDAVRRRGRMPSPWDCESVPQRVRPLHLPDYFESERYPRPSREPRACSYKMSAAGAAMRSIATRTCRVRDLACARAESHPARMPNHTFDLAWQLATKTVSTGSPRLPRRRGHPATPGLDTEPSSFGE
jgi:hypothetical protein